MPEPADPSKPPHRRVSRFWLVAPFVLTALLALAGSVGWWVERIRLETRLDQTTKALKVQGVDISWTKREVSGFPFRLDVTLVGPRIADRSGWALSAPQVVGEAFAYDPGHWIFGAPSGVTLMRPGKGALDVTGQALRISVSHLGSPAPRWSFQGLKLTFSPRPGAAPAMLAGADLLEAHLQPGPDDQAALLIRLDAGRSAGSGGLNGPGEVLALTWDSRLSHMSALAGSDWPGAVKHWSAAGGTMSVSQAKLTLGAIQLETRPATLTVGADGRLQGVMPLALSQGRAARTLLGTAPLSLTFQNGAARLGPLVLGPAFRVF